ncbi:hypothetical protein BD414DRAFT_536930 [Trametes punicea]|nr:hypothetical protein BD414DRAFT_536930 [Trametes punicea]
MPSRRIDPPYPSFSLVLSAPLPPRDTRTSRLPAYRASHMGRFHPYPRLAPPPRELCEENRLMMVRVWSTVMTSRVGQSTVDYRYAEEPLWEEEEEAGVDPQHASTAGEDDSESEDAADGEIDVQAPILRDEPPAAGGPEQPATAPLTSIFQTPAASLSKLGCVKLTVALSDVLAALRRKYVSLQVVGRSHPNPKNDELKDRVA